MRLKNIKGKLVYKNVTSKRIDWTGKSRSKLQYKFKQLFFPYWEKHVCYEEFPVYGTLLKVDILNTTKRIAVEVNGQQHNEFNRFFHNGSFQTYHQSMQRDIRKRDWLEMNGFQVLELEESDLDKFSAAYIWDRFKISIV